jgi:hypothetical protein
MTSSIYLSLPALLETVKRRNCIGGGRWGEEKEEEQQEVNVKCLLSSQEIRHLILPKG